MRPSSNEMTAGVGYVVALERTLQTISCQERTVVTTPMPTFEPPTDDAIVPDVIVIAERIVAAEHEKWHRPSRRFMRALRSDKTIVQAIRDRRKRRAKA